MDDKEYVRYTGHPGGQRFATPKEMLAKKPEEVIKHAVHGMLPKGRLGRTLNTNLFVFIQKILLSTEIYWIKSAISLTVVIATISWGCVR